MGIVPAAGLAQGIGPLGAAEVPVGTVPARGTAVLWVPGIVRAGVPAGTVPARGTAVLWVPGTGRAGVARGIDLAEAVLSAPGIGRVRGTARPWAGRGTGPADIGRLGAGPSYGCS